jgi:hypothetical protein
MSSSVIDYAVSFVIFIGLLTACLTITIQTLDNIYSTQVNQQRNTESLNLLNNILDTTGYPSNWGQTNAQVTQFGLRWTASDSTNISPFTPMRLSTSTKTIMYDGESYVDSGDGTLPIYIKTSDTLTYDQISQILSMKNNYGWRVTYTPLIDLETTLRQGSQGLTAVIKASTHNGPLGNATLDGTLIYCDPQAEYPFQLIQSSSGQTNPTGLGSITFSGFTPEDDQYLILERCNKPGISGVGYFFNEQSSDASLGAFISNYTSGSITLVHRKDYDPQYPNINTIFYNSTYIIPVGVNSYRLVRLDNGSGEISPSNPADIDLGIVRNTPGALIIFYKVGTQLKTIIIPWGISTTSMSSVFGDTPLDTSSIITKSREVLVNGCSYEVSIELWKRGE